MSILSKSQLNAFLSFLYSSLKFIFFLTQKLLTLPTIISPPKFFCGIIINKNSRLMMYFKI